MRAMKIGDLATAVPALRALARAFPMHRRVLCAPEWLTPLVALSGTIDEVVSVDDLGPRAANLARCEVAVNLHGRGPESTELLRELEPARLIAFGEPPQCVEWRDGEHERKRWCRLLSEHGIAADPNDMQMRPPRMRPPVTVDGATLVHPGASSPARRWPADRFAAVAREELRQGRQVFITGDDADRATAEAVAEGAGLSDDAILAGRTTLLELAATVAHAGRVCTNDTGVAHLATAFGTPSVVLFGPVPPSESGPPIGNDRHIALWAGRRGDPHAADLDPGLARIRVDTVIDALSQLD